MIVSSSLRRHLFRVVAAAVLALALLVSLRPSAAAATYRNHIARVPATPTSAETVTVWIESNTVSGETAGVETKIGNAYTKYFGTYDDTNGPDPSNWKVVLPAQPNGTTVEYQLFNCNENGCGDSNNHYGFTGFNWSYTVDDGDIQWSGLRHDTFDAYYRSPFGAVAADTNVTLRFRTIPLDVDGVDVRVYTYDPSTNPPSTSGPVDYPMSYLEDVGGYAFWTLTLDTPNSPAILYYHFKVTDGLDVDWYGDDHGGPHDNLNQGGTGAASDNQGAEGFQLTVYDPAFQTPAWLKGANVYQVFPDRFRNGDPARDYCQPGNEELPCPVFYGDQDVLFRSPWNTLIGDPRTPGPYFNEYGTQFYGGDLAGLMEKLDYLKAAGFDTIYTTPIFSGRSNHRYDTDDYMSVDMGLGSLSDFQALITAMDARGMKLIVDGVFNHTSSDSEYFDRYHRYADNDFIGACESLTSPYRSWFEFLNNDIPCGTGDYTGWFGYDSLAVLQDGSADVRDYIYAYDNNSVVETWYQRGVAGWRFDVADEISHNWWRDFRPYAKSYKADGPLVGEVWPDASAFLLGDQLDSVMNYRFRKNVLGFVRQAGFADNDNNGTNQIINLTPSQFDRALMSVREDYPPEATAAMLNLLDSHDTNRLRYLVDILGETDAQTLQRQKLAALFQYTYVGAPMVYYGDEVAIDSPSLANGVNGPEDDPYNRAPYPWSDEAGDTNVYGPADGDMLAFYSLLGSLRQNSDALRYGSFYTVLTGDTSPDPNDNTTYAFTRILLASEAVVAINPGTSSNTAVLAIEADPGRVMEDKLTGTEYTVDSNGAVTVTLPPRTGVLLMDPTPTSLTVKKVVVGAPPANPWQFGGDQGSFTLPAAGGQTTFSPVPAGEQVIGETDLGGWVPAVSCAPGGETGNASVLVTLDEGEQATCTFTNTQCQPGTYDTGGTSCVAANPGYYVDTAGATSQTECSPGTYQGNYAAVSCNLADPGYYAGGYAAPAQTACLAGTYQPNSGQESCLTADAGYFVASEAAQQQTECALGSYQPDSGQTSCLLADAGYYVDTTAATSQTACPSGTTSPQGSDSIDDCTATTATLTIAKITDPPGGTDFPFTLDPGAVTFADKWGSNGIGQGDFNGPFGVAVDGDGNVYVADTFNYRIQKFDAGGNFILMWGKDVKSGSPTGYEVCLAADTCKAGVSGSGNGEFNIPHGIAVDDAGNVYVADKFNNRIQRFDTSGNYLGQWGSVGSGNGEFDRPSGVAVDAAGNVYVADTDNDRVQKFSAAGGYLGQWGGVGGGNGQFNDPYGVAVGEAGGVLSVYVADTFNHRVQSFDGNGVYQGQWNANGSGNGPFDRPYGVATDNAGNVYVSDSGKDRVLKFDALGSYLFTSWGSAGSGDGQFDVAMGVAVNAFGEVYVVDNSAHRIQRFAQTGTSVDDGQSNAFNDLAPGTYLVSELVPDNWTLDDITCDGGSPVEYGHAVSVTLAAGNNVTCTFSNSYTAPDTTPPTVTINQASGQADPTSSSPINFTVVFSEPVIGFATGDVTLGGTAGATTATVSGGPTTYNVAVSGMTSSGTVIATVAANVAEDAAGNDNTASTSTDNEVTYNAPDTTAPTVTINQASGQSDPTSTSPINFTVVFSEPVSGFATGDVTLSGTAGATTATVSGGPTTYNVAVSGMTGSGTVIVSIAANVAEDAAGNDNTASTSTDNSVTYNMPTTTGGIYVTAAGGKITNGPTYQKNDILRWDGNAWSVWFDGASAGMLATADIIAFDVDDDDDGSAWVVIRQAQKLPGVGKMEPQQVAYYNGTTWTRFFDGRDVGLLSTGERINGLEVLPGSASPIGNGCLYYVLISTVAGGGVPVGSTNVNFTGEDVLGFCMTSMGANTAGTWHVVFEGQSQGLQKNNNLGLSASDDAATLYFTVKSNFTGDGGLVRPSQLFSFSNGVFSGPLWKAADHGLTQLVDGIDVVGSIP